MKTNIISYYFRKRVWRNGQRKISSRLFDNITKI